MRKTPTSELSKLQERFSKLYVDGDCRNGTLAAKQAGAKVPRQWAFRTLRLSYIQARIKELKKARAKQVVKAVAKVATEQLDTARYEVTREVIIQRMAQLYLDPKVHIDHKDVIAAGKQLGEWLGMKEKTRDPFAQDDIFAGKTEEELDYYAINSRFPDSPIN